jgi:hypothetical protein
MAWCRLLPWAFAAGFVALAACTTEDRGQRPEQAARPAAVERSAPASRLSRAACEALWSDAQAQEEAFDRAHAACARDADCAYPPSCGCSEGCRPQVAKAALPEREALAKKLAENECARWRAGGCPETTPMPMPSCVMSAPSCKGGRCGGR